MSDSRKIEITLDYQNYIETPPVRPAQLYGNACSSDTITIDSWRNTWIKNIQKNHETLGSFARHSIGRIFGSNQYRPAVVAGSGPSLGYNGEHLKDRGEIPLVSCLHNYHFFEDRGVKVDYYVSLDAGPVVLEEVSEGGTRTPEEYWESTKDKKLCAFIGSDPELFKKWQGELFLFMSPIPDQRVIEEVAKVEDFGCFVSTGGNVLGACLYIAKAIMGSNPIAFVGADFSFGYNTGKGYKFHSWDSKYDAKMGNVIRGVDVYGNKVLTWPSYYNFKNWFDYIALQIPGIYVNCTEGGIFGAYPEGNLMAVKQMAVKDFVKMFTMNQVLKEQFENPAAGKRMLLF